ncbi:DedA family protein [Micromonospora sp. NBC_01813]|uniref:DedA family protein n=1 Tax=Micromonospora sp. NBC_01813 TaxID=2975988 RepID=UPI002DD90C1D|nr:DedA family protein [Micromonospora sp. NBC_01813]WSA08641.1 DedA family protein [Micromonospora sp. NBC_01813]
MYFAADGPAGGGPADGGITGYVVSLMEKLGGPGAGLAVALENLFPPIPSEVILPLAGFTASQGRMSLTGAIFWTTLGSLLGALALYYIGAALGRDRVRRIAEKIPLIKLSDVDKTEAWFLKHGKKAVFFGRMIPIFRSLISIPAGVERMPVGVFALYTTAGSLIWNTTFVIAGYSLGENWHLVESYAGVLQRLVILACVLAAGWFAVSRIRQVRRAARAPGVDTGIEKVTDDSPEQSGGTVYRSRWAADTE